MNSESYSTISNTVLKEEEQKFYHYAGGSKRYTMNEQFTQKTELSFFDDKRIYENSIKNILGQETITYTIRESDSIEKPDSFGKSQSFVRKIFFNQTDIDLLPTNLIHSKFMKLRNGSSKVFSTTVIKTVEYIDIFQFWWIGWVSLDRTIPGKHKTTARKAHSLN